MAVDPIFDRPDRLVAAEAQRHEPLDLELLNSHDLADGHHKPLLSTQTLTALTANWFASTQTSYNTGASAAGHFAIHRTAPHHDVRSYTDSGDLEVIWK